MSTEHESIVSAIMLARSETSAGSKDSWCMIVSWNLDLMLVLYYLSLK